MNQRDHQHRDQIHHNKSRLLARQTTFVTDPEDPGIFNVLKIFAVRTSQISTTECDKVSKKREHLKVAYRLCFAFHRIIDDHHETNPPVHETREIFFESMDIF